MIKITPSIHFFFKSRLQPILIDTAAKTNLTQIIHKHTARTTDQKTYQNLNTQKTAS